MGRFLSTEPVILNLPTAIPKLPERGTMIYAHSVLSSPGGGYLGMVAVARMDVETGMLSVLGTGPNSFLIRKNLEQNGVKILTKEVIGDVGVGIQLVEDAGDTTVIVSAGVEAEAPMDQIEEVELREGDVVLVHGAAFSAGTQREEFAQWVSSIQEGVTVVLAPSPLVDQIDPTLWKPMLARADIITMNLRETQILPEMLKQVDPDRELRDYLKPGCIQVRRMGADGCEYRVGLEGEFKHVPAYPTEAVDTAGVGHVHVAVMCGALAREQEIEPALQLANAAGAVMISHAYTFPIPTMRDIADVMTFGGE